jgi:poly(3-hydroxybutyrate) depolymerase
MRTLLALSLPVAFAFACASENEPGSGVLQGDGNPMPDDGGGVVSPGSDAGQNGPRGDSGTGPKADGGSPTTTGTLQPGDRGLTISVGGQSRSVQLHVPAALGTQAYPLILALHGNGDTAANFMATSGLAARTDAIVAAPQGIQRDVSVGGATAPNVAWDAYTSRGTNIDVALLDAIVADLSKSGSVDARHIITFGYSQGGYLSYRYAKESADTLACAAVVAAADPSGIPKAFARKIPFVIQIGSNDYAIQNARSSKAALMAAGHEVLYNEIAGAGHVPFPGAKDVPLTFCLGKSL